MTETEIQLHHVTLDLCGLCLNGEGGQCHSPGCALYLNRAPDIPVWSEGVRVTDVGPAAMTPGRFLDTALNVIRPHLSVAVVVFEPGEGGTLLLVVDGNLRADRGGRPAEIRAAYQEAAEAVIAAVEAAGIEFEASPSVTIGSGDGTWPEAVMRMVLVPPGTAASNGLVAARHAAAMS